ncbi:TetR/AcrR family transcriptional regulator [Mariniflexile ostreae]|uniref:TetR/AcrR family transcriptional regulator n=1 Tax=Mariniflexile ostreae TaxID=1520892 RepID=A0ABV5F933_9FLAO
MREKILIGATDLFLSYGFKSVTMDDIANTLAVSKKTIYQHFENKTRLVEATTEHLFHGISHGIEQICASGKNPIEEIFSIKHFVAVYLKNEKASPQYQLQKYYPKIFKKLKTQQFCVMQTCVSDNLNRGIALGLYRDTIHVDFISRIYYNTFQLIKDKDLFPEDKFSMKMLLNNYIEYHLRGICTAKGLETLHNYINSNPS